MLTQLSEVVTSASALLLESIEHPDPEQRKEFYKQIKEKEREGDTVTHHIFDELSTTFITPFEREDIHRLASHTDDVIDNINSCAKRIAIYNPHPIGKSGQELCQLIDEEARLIHTCMGELSKFKKNPAPMLECCIRLHDIENHADDIYEEFTNRLFREETDFVEIIKIKEIMHELERTTDTAEYVGKILRSFVVKYA
jgi:predicted phosphate transport protein (TIGR00153 family)